MNRILPDENWSYVLKLLPKGWELMARQTGGVKRMRGADSLGDLLRTMLLHMGHGCSLRTTVVTAKAAGWASLSDVALLKRIRASEVWLQRLCAGLVRESEMKWPKVGQGYRLRLVDSTLIQEPGDTGSQWRVFYSLRVPDWQCDFFHLTPVKGKGNGESLRQFAVKPGDCLLADRGFSHLAGVDHVVAAGGYVLLRLNMQTTPLENKDGTVHHLMPWLAKLENPGEIGSAAVWLPSLGGKGARRIRARVCAIRKSVEATALAQRKLRRRAQRTGAQLRPQTLEFSSWVVVLTTLPEKDFSPTQILEWYRVRWQVELAFKRLKSLADVGHLPKKNPASCRAWIYGKLLIALLTEKMQRQAASFSPWGGRWLDQDPPPQPLA